VFFILTCSKKRETDKIYKSENEEVTIIENEEIIFIKNEEITTVEDKTNNNTMCGYNGYYSNDHVKFIWDLLLEKNKDDDVYFGSNLEYISTIKVDIDATEGETWFSSWHIDHTIPYNVNCLHLHIIKEDNIIKTYRIPNRPAERLQIMEDEVYLKYIKFPLLKNIQ
jgi:hypothetical protein